MIKRLILQIILTPLPSALALLNRRTKW